MEHPIIALSKLNEGCRIGWHPHLAAELRRLLAAENDLLIENDALRFALNVANLKLAKHTEVIDLGENDWKEVKNDGS